MGTQGASYSFTPQEGCTVTVARSTVTDKMTFNGFTSQGVSVDKNGQVTVTGLTTGRHILRIEKDGMAAYQVITARGVSYDIIDADGNVLPQDAELVPGQAVKVQFHDLVSPKEKISGVYNFNFSLVYLDAQGSKYQTNPGTPFGQYDFSSNPARQLLSVTIPETAEGYSYDLTGTIRVGGFGGIPTHRGVSYRSGMDRQYGTTTAAVLTRLPELVLPLTGWYVHDVEQKIAAIGEVTLDSEEAIQAARTAYDALRQERKEQVSNYDVLLAAEARLAELNAENIYKTTGDYIAAKGAPVTGSIGGEWAVLGLARSGRDIPGTDDYYASVEEYVRKAMDEDGRLNRSRSTENSRLILALTALGIDPTADSRFVKSGVSVVDALCGFYVTGGGFRHLMADKTVDGMATEQGYYALAAYYRLTAGKTSLYDMSDVTITVMPDQPVTPDQPAKPDVPRTGDESPVLVWMGMAALAGAAVLLMQKKKKRA